MNTDLRMSMPRVMRDVTMTVHVDGVKMMHARIWLGARILALAARVIGCKFRVEMKP